jgi:hypothetical protein
MTKLTATQESIKSEWTLTRTRGVWVKDESCIKGGYWSKAFWYCERGSEYFYADTKKEAQAKVKELNQH